MVCCGVVKVPCEDGTLGLIAQHCGTLRRLSLGYSTCSEDALTNLLSGMSQLKELRLHWAQWVTDRTVELLLLQCLSLQFLDLTGCTAKELTSQAIVRLVNARARRGEYDDDTRKLLTLDCRFVNISKATRRKMAEAYPLLEPTRFWQST